MLERQKYEYLRSELKKRAEKLSYCSLNRLRSSKNHSYITKVESGERGLDIIEFIDYSKDLG